MKEEKIIKQIVAGIEKRKLPETKEILMLQYICGASIAHILAYNSGKIGWTTEDKEILMLQDETGYSVAHWLATHSGKTGWATDDKEILILQNKTGVSVAHELAYSHPTWTTSDPELLSLINKWGNTVKDILIAKGNKHRKNQTRRQNEKS